MQNQSNITGNHNILIQGVSNSTITLNVDGELQEIRNDIAALLHFLQSQQHESLQVGEKIYNIKEIGQAEFKTIIHQYQQESKRSFYLRVFLFVFVPALAIGFAYLLYQYQVLKQPLTLTIAIKNMTPNKELPSPNGKITLTYGNKSEVRTISQDEVFFKGIPANFGKQIVQVSFEAQGFSRIDTTLLLTDATLVLPVFRNNSLGRITGIINDDDGNFLEGVKISVQDLETYTDASGHFLLDIPFEKQRLKQRLTTFKAGYLTKDLEIPVIENETVRLTLHEN